MIQYVTAVALALSTATSQSSYGAPFRGVIGITCQTTCQFAGQLNVNQRFDAFGPSVPVNCTPVNIVSSPQYLLRMA